MSQFFVDSLKPRRANRQAPGNPLSIVNLAVSSSDLGPDGWSTAECFFGLLLAAVMADGEVAAPEREQLHGLIGRSRALQALSAEEIAAVAERVSERFRHDANAFEQACQALPQDMRLPMFAHVLDIVLADGDLTNTEAEFLNDLIDRLGIDETDAAKIADVMLIKNSY
ncbi:MAG: tellurite resistance TerB family protein [Hyphomonadaceae bacterium]